MREVNLSTVPRENGVKEKVKVILDPVALIATESPCRLADVVTVSSVAPSSAFSRTTSTEDSV